MLVQYDSVYWRSGGKQCEAGHKVNAQLQILRRFRVGRWLAGEEGRGAAATDRFGRPINR
jgi:hypothetical protein